MKHEIPDTLTNKGESIPVKKGLLFFGNAFSVMKDPLAFLVSLKNEYGEIVKIKIAGKAYYIVQSPEAIKHVLQENSKNYYKPGTAKLMKRFLREGLATSNGETWLKQRRIMQPAFHNKRINGFTEIIAEEVDSLIENWKQTPHTEPVNVNNEFLKLTLNNINKIMFGADLKTQLDRIVVIVNELLLSASGSVTSIVKFPFFIPTASNLRFRRANKEFEKIIHQIIEQRKYNKIAAKLDLLDMLMQAFDDESKTNMTANQLRDEVATIFMAGHETTAQTLSWVFYHLALHPDTYLKILEESKAIGNDQLTIDGFKKLTYTHMVIEETMRIYPPVWVMARKSFSEDNIAGYHLPAGSTILINIYGMNHHEKYWKNSFDFIPDRFQTHSKESRHPFLFIPFGAGQRPCIGSSLAMMVLQSVIFRLVQQFEFKIPNEFLPIVEPNITLRAKYGIRLLIKQKE